jgi:hypothetical protein
MNLVLLVWKNSIFFLYLRGTWCCGAVTKPEKEIALI